MKSNTQITSSCFGLLLSCIFVSILFYPNNSNATYFGFDGIFTHTSGVEQIPFLQNRDEINGLIGRTFQGGASYSASGHVEYNGSITRYTNTGQLEINVFGYSTQHGCPGPACLTFQTWDDNNYLEVLDDGSGGMDGFGIVSQGYTTRRVEDSCASSTVYPSWMGVSQIILGFTDYDGDFISSYHSSGSAPDTRAIYDAFYGTDPAGFDEATLRIYMDYDYYGNTPYMIEGNIENIYWSSSGTVVPEPATMLLFGTGLAGLVGSRLRKKKK